MDLNGQSYLYLKKEPNSVIDSNYDIPGVHNIGLDYSALIYLKMLLD